MKRKIETTVTIEYPESYPKTPECEKYLQLRAKYEDAQVKRTARDLAAALGGTSGLNNAVNNDEFRKIQTAYHDCAMTAMMFFAAKKAQTSRDMIVENNSGLRK